VLNDSYVTTMSFVKPLDMTKNYRMVSYSARVIHT
jgi:hypothetical protein